MLQLFRICAIGTPKISLTHSYCLVELQATSPSFQTDRPFKIQAHSFATPIWKPSVSSSSAWLSSLICIAIFFIIYWRIHLLHIIFAGSWVHCGYHLTTSIVAPALLSLPFALAFLGWVGGVLCLIIEALVTFYSYNLLSLVLEHHAKQGVRLLRFREMAEHILGK